MDFLGHLIEEKCSGNLWHPVKASQSGSTLSHLFFAGDLVFFARADYVNCSAIRDVLDDFCSISGQTVSEAKSRVYFSPNVDRDTRESLCDILGFASTPNLGKYLGIPLKHPRSSSQDYNFILDRVKHKLAGWKANMLSLVSHSILIQASLATIPAYVMQCTHLSGKILEGIDRVNRNFLWGTSEAAKKIHRVGWQKVTKPKDEGGLGLQTAKGRNISLLAKLIWRLSTEKEALWVKALKHKYCNQQRERAISADRLPCSQVWIAIKRGREVFTKGSMWIVGRDSNLSFWQGNWTKRGPIRKLIQGPLTQEAAHCEVKDVLVNTSWDWSKIPFDLSEDIRLMIQATPVSITGRGSDRLEWVDNPKGNFELKSAYNLVGGSTPSQTFTASWIWKSKTLPCIRTFLWRCAHESIRVKHCLGQRGVVDEDICPICPRDPETVLHVLRDCSWVKAVWLQLGVKMTNQCFWLTNLQDWLNVNGKTISSYNPGNPPWNMVYPFALWNLWKCRNNAVFNRKSQNPRLAAEIIQQTWSLCIACLPPEVLLEV